MEYILFPAVGKTDPITKYYDGSMLHICRTYKPQKVYIYLSKEMMQFHQLDDRYRKCLQWLQDKEKFQMEIHIIERPDLVDVHLFEAFYDDYEALLAEIQQENPSAQILLNVSAGTPAMKSALQFIAASSGDGYLPIQVSTPQKGANREKYDFEKYDVELKWELNLDNSETSNRCEESQTILLNKRIKQEIIIKHIEAYDYRAALEVAESIKKLLPQKALLILKAAVYRLALDLSQVERLTLDSEIDLLPIKSSDIKNIFEYILWLQVKQKRGDLADFIRGISPVLTDIFMMAAKNKCNFDVTKCCPSVKKDKVPKMRRNLIAKNYPEALKILDKAYKGKGAFKDNSVVAASALMHIIKEMSHDKTISELAVSLRKIEENARNIAAHEIASITEEWIQGRTNYTSEQILQKIKDLFQRSVSKNSSIKKEYWNSYDLMNQTIIEALQEKK